MTEVTHRIAGLAVVVAVGMLLGGCSGSILDLSRAKSPPDEFTVVSRAPLVLPPNFNLRPPEPGAPRPQEAQPNEQARQLMFQRQMRDTDVSQAEMVLLRSAGADQADPDIRTLVNRETARLQETARGFADYILFWQDPRDPNTVVDARAEVERLRQNQSEGKPPNEGEVPVIQRSNQRSLF